MSDDIFDWSLPWGAPESHRSLEAGRLRQLGIDIPAEIPDITVMHIELTIPRVSYKKAPEVAPAPDPTVLLQEILAQLKMLTEVLTAPRRPDVRLTPVLEVPHTPEDHPGLAAEDHPGLAVTPNTPS